MEADSHGLAVQQTTVIPLLQYIDKVVDMPVVFNDMLGSYSCLDPVVDILVVAQMQIPLVQLPSRFSHCSTLIRWSTFIVQVQFLECTRGGDSRAPTIAPR